MHDQYRAASVTTTEAFDRGAGRYDLMVALNPGYHRELRRAELKAEIAKEEQALTDAKQAYKEGEEKPEVWKHTKTVTGPDGKTKQVTETGRNVAAYEEKMKKLQQEVDAHESRLQKLKGDLVNLDTKGQKP